LPPPFVAAYRVGTSGVPVGEEMGSLVDIGAASSASGQPLPTLPLALERHRARPIEPGEDVMKRARSGRIWIEPLSETRTDSPSVLIDHV